MAIEDYEKEIKRLRKEGYIVDAVGPDGLVTMMTEKGLNTYNVLSLLLELQGTFQSGATNATQETKDTKPKKSGQEKMDSAIKTVVKVGAGISQFMEGLGKIAGDPVKMDMSQAGIDFGQNKPKAKPRKKTAKKRRSRR